METIKYLNAEETVELFDIVNKDNSNHGIRNKAMFHIAKFCALRVSEIGMLKMASYDERKGELYCTREKGSYSNTLRIIDEDVKYYFDSYYQVRKKMNIDSKYIFISQKGYPISRKTLDWIIKKYCKLTTLSADKWHFHVLRHTRAIELAETSCDIKDIQWWLGHKNINNTMIYLRFTTKQQEALYTKLKEGSIWQKNQYQLRTLKE